MARNLARVSLRRQDSSKSPHLISLFAQDYRGNERRSGWAGPFAASAFKFSASPASNTISSGSAMAGIGEGVELLRHWPDLLKDLTFPCLLWSKLGEKRGGGRLRVSWTDSTHDVQAHVMYVRMHVPYVHAQLGAATSQQASFAAAATAARAAAVSITTSVYIERRGIHCLTVLRHFSLRSLCVSGLFRTILSFRELLDRYEHATRGLFARRCRSQIFKGFLLCLFVVMSSYT